MDGMLSQDEINALLGQMEGDMDDGGAVTDDNATAPSTGDELLSPEESDAVGEIANISMGTAATTLSVLVNNRVEITTPRVGYTTVDQLKEKDAAPCVFIYISYKMGLEGKNVLILKEDDVKVITDLMMGGDGTNTDTELSELHLSAISEAMNQMMGSAATSMSSMINEMVDISPPTAVRVDLGEGGLEEVLGDMVDEQFVDVKFKMQIGSLVDSEIMQLYPLGFARMIYEKFSSGMLDSGPEEVSQQVAPAPAPTPAPEPAVDMSGMQAQPMPNMQQNMQPMFSTQPVQNVNIQPAQFQSFAQPTDLGGIAPENIDLIMDVPLEVTVELGRTSKSIKEILDFTPGTIIELEKIAGEPIDVLVNGKFVAKGEVVVIEENFGIRITEILKD